MEHLNSNQREVIILRHMEGLAFNDIARRMDRTVDSVKSLWTRAIYKLREKLRGHV